MLEICTNVTGSEKRRHFYIREYEPQTILVYLNNQAWARPAPNVLEKLSLLQFFKILPILLTIAVPILLITAHALAQTKYRLP